MPDSNTKAPYNPSERPSEPHPGASKFISHDIFPRMQPYDAIPPPHADAIASINSVYRELSDAFPNLVRRFEDMYTIWDENRDSRNDEYQERELIAWLDLVDMGPKIIPLVVHKLAQEDGLGFHAVKLYNELEKDPAMKIDPDTPPWNILDFAVLQRQANLVLDLNHQRKMAVDNRVKDWKIHLEQYTEQPRMVGSDVAASGEAYLDLVGLGEGIIGNLMAEYHRDQAGPWHEILYNLCNGSRPAAGTMTREELFVAWKEWFEHVEQFEPPPTPPAR